jgi:prepilin-type processing-associated H-X9-DG protein
VLTDSAPGAVGDYAVSIGTTGIDYPLTLSIPNPPPPIPPNGAFQQTTGLRAADFSDGLSNTLLVGEKFVPRGAELTYPYDCNLYDGHNPICSTRAAGPGFPIAQGPADPLIVFGGPHPGICQFAFADGSVRPVRSSIDEFTLGLLSARNDGLPVPSDY